MFPPGDGAYENTQAINRAGDRADMRELQHRDGMV